jgi:hypothetical protein
MTQATREIPPMLIGMTVADQRPRPDPMSRTAKTLNLNGVGFDQVKRLVSIKPSVTRVGGARSLVRCPGNRRTGN